MHQSKVLSDSTAVRDAPQFDAVCTPGGMKTLIPIFENSWFPKQELAVSTSTFWCSLTFVFVKQKPDSLSCSNMSTKQFSINGV